MARENRLKTLFIAALLALAAGCRQEGIRVYDIPKEQTPTHADAGHAAHAPLPPGWEEVPPGQMRLASYVVHGTNGAKAEVSVSTAGGRDLDNVNRWRSQVGVQPLTEEQLRTNAQPVTVAGEQAQMFEAAGSSVERDEPTRILGVIQKRADATLFFKMMGDDTVVQSQKPAFVQFLQGFQLGHNHEHASTGDPHAGLNMASADVAGATPSAAPNQSWPAPASWKQQPPGAMQDAKFLVGDGKALVTVSRAGGGLLANVNRWRGQLGMEPIDENGLDKAVTTLDLPAGKAKLVDLAGASQRMVVAIVPTGTTTSTFYKLMGEPAAVAVEKNAFVEFVKAAK